MTTTTMKQKKQALRLLAVELDFHHAAAYAAFSSDHDHEKIEAAGRVLFDASRWRKNDKRRKN